MTLYVLLYVTENEEGKKRKRVKKPDIFVPIFIFETETEYPSKLAICFFLQLTVFLTYFIPIFFLLVLFFYLFVLGARCVISYLGK